MKLNNNTNKLIVLASIIMGSSGAFAADTTINALAVDVDHAKQKSDNNSQRIESAQAGAKATSASLTTEITNRIAADQALQNSINTIALTPGPKGDKGDQGIQGIQGIQGEVGATGPQGIQGETGAAGVQGVAGADGSTGADGAQGIQGEAGPQGLVGATGAQGIQGEVGATGSQGIQGETGAAGPQGVAGADGSTGADGQGVVDGISQGDMLYWNGFTWEVIPVPFGLGTEPLVLTLVNGVPMWTSSAAPVIGLGTCSNGSNSDCNPVGSTLGLPVVDVSPPDGWVQCAGFKNTPADDVSGNFMDNCLNTASLRVRVYDASGKLVEDIFSTNLTQHAIWPQWSYLGGTINSQVVTNWGATTFFSTTDSRDACGQAIATYGTPTLGTGNGSVAIIAGGALDNSREYSINCNGAGLLDHTVFIYK